MGDAGVLEKVGELTETVQQIADREAVGMPAVEKGAERFSGGPGHLDGGKGLAVDPHALGLKFEFDEIR